MDSVEKTEEQLSQELEAMYTRVASIEMPADENIQTSNIELHQKECLIQTLDEGQQEDNIRTYQLRQGNFARPTVAGMHKTAPDADNKTEPDMDSALPTPAKKRPLTAAVLALALVCMMTALLLLLIWPALYEYALIIKDGNLHPVRIHKITGKADYLDAENWRNLPDNSTALRVPASTVPVPPVKPSAWKESLPEQAMPPETRHSLSFPEETKTSTTPAGKGQKRGAFSIQIKAFDNLPETHKLVAELKNKGVDAFSVEAAVGNRGVWHRVMIGQFNTADEAIQFVKSHKIRDSYPDSFIQKISQ